MKVVLMDEAEIEQLIRKVSAATLEAFIEQGQPTGSARVEQVMNIEQCAEFVGLKIPTLYRKTSANEIPHFKNCGRVFFQRSEVEAWLLSRKVPTKNDYQFLADEHLADRARRR